MFRGSTPTHKFYIPFSVDVIDKVLIAYAQNDNVLFVKEVDSSKMDGQSITVKLTQDETLLFDCFKRIVQIQLKIKTLGGDVLISKMTLVDLERCLFDEVI